MPTLTVVALKMLPIYEADDLQHIENELGVLLGNLAELRLISSDLTNSETHRDDVGHDRDALCDTQTQTDRSNLHTSGFGTFSACPQLLAMYDGECWLCWRWGVHRGLSNVIFPYYSLSLCLSVCSIPGSSQWHGKPRGGVHGRGVSGRRRAAGRVPRRGCPRRHHPTGACGIVFST